MTYRNGITSRTMSRSGTSAILFIMKSSSPYGGVTSPIMMLTTHITPKCTRSIPSACAVGISTGRITRMIVVPSRKQPRISSSTLTTSRNTIGDSS